MAVPRKSSKHAQTPGTSTHRGAATNAFDDREQFVLTLSKPMHDVLEIARVDNDGVRHPLFEDEIVQLAGHEEEIDEAMRYALEAFEAGLVEGLGVEDEEDDFDGDALLSRLLLSCSAEQGVLRMDMHRGMLRRLVLRRMLRGRRAQVPTEPEQRRRSISVKARNGSGSTQ